MSIVNFRITFPKVYCLIWDISFYKISFFVFVFVYLVLLFLVLHYSGSSEIYSGSFFLLEVKEKSSALKPEKAAFIVGASQL